MYKILKNVTTDRTSKFNFIQMYTLLPYYMKITQQQTSKVQYFNKFVIIFN